jgi:hypothetical protein
MVPATPSSSARDVLAPGNVARQIRETGEGLRLRGDDRGGRDRAHPDGAGRQRPRRQAASLLRTIEQIGGRTAELGGTLDRQAAAMGSPPAANRKSTSSAARSRRAPRALQTGESVAARMGAVGETIEARARPCRRRRAGARPPGVSAQHVQARARDRGHGGGRQPASARDRHGGRAKMGDLRLRQWRPPGG